MPATEAAQAEPATLEEILRRLRAMDPNAHVQPREFVAAYREFVVTHGAGLRSPGTLRDHLPVLAPHFEGKDVHTITNADVEAFMAARMQQGKAPATINRNRSGLMKFIGWCVDKRYAVANPVLKVKKLKEPGGRTRFLSPEEFERLMRAARRSAATYLPLFIFAAVHLGGRRRELLSLRWCDINAEAGFVRFRCETTKSARERIVPMVPELAGMFHDTLAAQRALGGDQEHVFTFRGRRVELVNTSFKRACRLAGIENLHVHDLRHSFGSNFMMAGGSLYVLQRLLGHSEPRMTQRYGHLSREYLLASMALIGVPGRPKAPAPVVLEAPAAPPAPTRIPARTIEVLQELRAMFGETQRAYLTTHEVLERLSPRFPDLRGPKTWVAQVLSKMLRPVGVRAAQVGQREGYGGCKGYRLGALAPAFARYLSD